MLISSMHLNFSYVYTDALIEHSPNEGVSYRCGNQYALYWSYWSVGMLYLLCALLSEHTSSPITALSLIGGGLYHD